ncbi:hypothetical protein [Klebsiella sp. S69]|uniref:hypothetical protein n=1 Tax=Klebsiella sp. S69 TaxID=2767439 RepID=UPI00190876E3|nr:hypothetical protein [Klebsiella sp. S69]MBK0167374.1 hypothetical protein [Klebsiella sp. S69]
MLLPEKLAYVHSIISAAFAVALIKHYRQGDKDPSIKSKLLITILILMALIALTIGILWLEYHYSA